MINEENLNTALHDRQASQQTQASQHTVQLHTREEAVIQRRAYNIWEEKGRTHGHALDDWLEAERG